MNNDGTAGGNNVGLVQMDDQQMITLPDRENYVARMYVTDLKRIYL